MKQMAKGNGAATSLREKISTFVTIVEELMRHKEDDAHKLIWLILEKTGYLEWIGEEKKENLTELAGFAKGKYLQEFIDFSSLSGGIDEPHNGEFISLMTLHSAKGLEFPVIFIIGIEDGLLPHFHTLKNQEELQEERRLFYVGMTRAKDLLVLSSSKKRKLYTSLQKQKPSRFLSDIPTECYHFIEKKPKREAVIASVNVPSSLRYSSPFFTGVRVKHPKWGVGVVRDCYGDCEDPKVMVNFSTVGVKRLSLKFANLEKL
jgi:DNA helicase-2/ATP-dependent DNA helicase PcrA